MIWTEKAMKSVILLKKRPRAPPLLKIVGIIIINDIMPAVGHLAPILVPS